jgi:flagellar biosynthesis regulator FlaF
VHLSFWVLKKKNKIKKKKKNKGKEQLIEIRKLVIKET